MRCALLCALAMTTVGAARPDLGQVLARMRDASGPVWHAHLTSASRLVTDGEAAALVSDASGLRFTSRQCTGSLCAGTYFDGERLFSVDINNTALPRSRTSEPAMRAVRTIASLAFLDPAFVDNGGTLSALTDAKIGGKHYISFLVANGDATPMRVYVDPRTYHIAYARDVDGDVTLEYRDYRHVDAAYVLPFTVLQNGAVLETYSARHASNAPYIEPRGIVPTFDGAPVAIETDPDHPTPIFPCTLAGIATHCLLDTGNSSIAISSKLANQLKLRSIGQLQVRGLGKFATQVVRTGPLTFGNATFPAADYVELGDIDTFGYDVVLGADILAQGAVDIDPATHHITFHAGAPRSSTVTLPLAFQNFIPVVNVQLGTVDAQLAVDTGDDSNINLSYDFYRNHQDLFSATEQHTIKGVGGESVEVVGNIPEVKIGDLSVGEQRIGATQTLQGTAYGHLGAAFLAHFRVVLDYANGELHLVPDASKPPQP